jgi:DNA topoisomerase IB
MFSIISMDKQKKYIYDPIKEGNKQCHLLELSSIIPRLRKDIRDHLDNFKYSSEDVIYLILAVIDICQFRVGNTKYKNSTGVSTIKCGQIDSNSSNTNISFHGKRQVVNSCQILSGKINKILGKLSEYKDDDDFLFTYVDLNGNTQRVNAENTNRLLARYGNITTKMFRTWKANYYFIKNIKRLEIPTNKTGITRNISKAVGATAEKLYHTKAICRRSYIDSRIVNFYKEDPEMFVETIRDLKLDNKYLISGEQDLIRLLGDQCL